MTQESKPQIPNALWLAWGTVLFWTGFFHHQPLWGILWAWALAFIILNILRPRVLRHRGRELLVWLLLAALSYNTLSQLDFQKLLRDESLDGISTRLGDKAALGDLPAIFPRIITEGMPQDFYVFAPGANRLTLTIDSTSLPGTSLGHGLFKVQSRDLSIRGETTTVTLETNLKTTPRKLDVIKALPHPKTSCGAQSSTAYVLSEETDEIFAVTSHGSIETLKTGNGPSACIVRGNELIVSHLYEAMLWVFDATTHKLIRQEPLGSGAKSMALSVDEQVLALTLQGAQTGVVLLSTALKQIAFINLPLVPEWITPGPTSKHWNISSRQSPALIHLQEQEGAWQTNTHKLSRPFISMISDPTGHHLYATTTGYSPQGETLIGNHFIQDQILKLDSLELKIISRLLTQRRAETPKAPGDFLKWTAGAGPSSMSLLKNGDLLVSFSGTTQWWRVPANLAGPIQDLPIRKAGLSAPHDATELSDGTLVLTSPSEGTIALFRPDQETTELHQLGPSDEQLQASAPQALKRRHGEKGFYEATRSGRSCQSCHLHADSDHSIHNIGDQELMPATLSVRSVAGTSPYLRGGVYNRIRELLHVPNELLGGYFITDPLREQHIEAFVKSLAQPGNPLSSHTEPNLQREQRGLKAFIKARCSLCHAFPAFTDLSQHPARRIFPNFPDPNLELDTPSLLNLKSTPPYLFDGRAQTIAEIFENVDENNQHGHMANLSSQEQDDLIFFLESL